jgi:type 1 fimbriae regulatory protein FimE
MKGGIVGVHPLHGPELRALRPLQGNSPCVFVTEAGRPVTTAWYLRMVQRTGKPARLPFPVHPHMLRHLTGYKLANGIVPLDVEIGEAALLALSR